MYTLSPQAALVVGYIIWDVCSITSVATYYVVFTHTPIIHMYHYVWLYGWFICNGINLIIIVKSPYNYYILQVIISCVLPVIPSTKLSSSYILCFISKHLHIIIKFVSSCYCNTPILLWTQHPLWLNGFTCIITFVLITSEYRWLCNSLQHIEDVVFHLSESS